MLQRWPDDEATRPEINLPMRESIARDNELREIRANPERCRRPTIPIVYRDLERGR